MRLNLWQLAIRLDSGWSNQVELVKYCNLCWEVKDLRVDRLLLDLLVPLTWSAFLVGPPPNQNYMLTCYLMAFWLKNVASTVDKDEFVCRSVFYKGKHRENRKELMERSVSGCIQLCGELPWSKPALWPPLVVTNPPGSIKPLQQKKYPYKVIFR